MKLYNQSDRDLCWDMARRTFECEPFGQVEVPEKLLPFVERRGLPLATSPVAAETRAAQKAARAKREAEEGDTIQLRNRAEDAEAALADARRLLEQEQQNHVRTAKERDKVAAKAEEQAATIAELRADLKATEAKLRESMARVADLEQAAGRRPSAEAADDEEESDDVDDDLPSDKDELVKMAKDLELEGVDGRSSVAKLKAAIRAEIG